MRASLRYSFLIASGRRRNTADTAFTPYSRSSRADAPAETGGPPVPGRGADAGVGGGGLVWESSAKDWEWVLGVNLMGVVHGIRVFTPVMLEASKKDPAYRGHITNTASMAGLLAAPNMGVYTVSKHAVVALSETLYQDLSLVTDQIRASVLCPYFVPTGIADSARNRPADLTDEETAWLDADAG